MALQHLRSSTAHKRPIPTVMSAGQIAINTNEASPALFFKDSNGDLVKVGPVHIGTDAPNSSPASVAATALVTGTVYQILTVGTTDFTLVGAASNTVGTIFTATGTTTGTGTVSGQQGVEKGEMWLDTTGGTYVLKIYDGSAWRSESGTFVDSAGDTMTGALLLDNAASAAAPDLSFDGDANTGLYSPGADQIAIATGGNGRVFIDSSGNVGIGTTSPSQELSVNGNAILLANGELFFADGTNQQTASIKNGASSNTSQLQFFTSSTERMRIDSSGNLLVGKTSSSGLNAGCEFRPDGMGLFTKNSANPLQVRRLSDDGDLVEFYKDTLLRGSIGVSGSSLTVGVAGSEKARIDSSGRLLVGTNSGSYDFEVKKSGHIHGLIGSTNAAGATLLLDGDSDGDGMGSDYASLSHTVDGNLILENRKTASIIFRNTASSTERMRIDSSGRLLIGTTTEGYAAYADNLTIADSSDCGMTIRSGTSNQGNIYFSDGTSGSDEYEGIIQYLHNVDAMAFGVNNGTERMRIDSSGRVGIGVSTMAGGAGSLSIIRNSALRWADSDGTQRADIYGDASSNLVFRNGTGSTERMRIDSSGNVGIGTTNIQKPFHVRKDGESYPLLVQNRTNAVSTAGIAFLASGSDFADGQYASIEALSGGTGSTAHNLLLRTSTSGGTPTERMRITSDGNVGIGNIAPGAKLQIEGTSDQLKLTYTSIASYIHEVHSNGDYSISKDATEQMRIDSSGRLLVGTSSASNQNNAGGASAREAKAYIFNANATTTERISLAINSGSADATGASLNLNKTRATTDTHTVVQSGDGLGEIRFQGSDGTYYVQGARIQAAVDGTPGSQDMPGRLVFSTTADGESSPTERMRISSNGYVYFANQTDANPAATGNQGLTIRPEPLISIAANGNSCANFGRNTNDGNIVLFYQAGTSEGTISVSGTTVSYNGAHLSRWSQLPGGAVRKEILRGTVLSNIDEMCEWGEEDNEQLNRMKVSDVEGERNVSGVFQAWDDDDDTYTNDFYCAMTGDFVIRIAQGTTVARGDLLMSAGDGTAKPQDDDIVRSKTIAKVTSTTVSTTYSDGSYCVPCVLMAC